MTASLRETGNGDATPAVSARGLRKVFGDTLAVGGLDLDIPRGSFFGLVGPNGAGKSTSLKMLTGLLRPDAGRAVVAGHDVWEDPPWRSSASSASCRREPLLFERLTGSQLLTYTGLLRGLAPEVVGPVAPDELEHGRRRGGGGGPVAHCARVRGGHGVLHRRAAALVGVPPPHEPRVLVVGALAILPVGTGVGQVASVLGPLPQPDSPTNAFATGSGAGCLQVVAVTVALLAMTLALLPVALGIGLTLTRGSAWSWTATVLGLAYAVGIQTVGHRVAVRLLERGPDTFLGRVEAASP